MAKTSAISIVTVDSGWILEKTAFRLCSELKKKVECSVGPPCDDVNVYVDIQNCYFKKTNGFDIGIFTHLHEDNLNYFQTHWLSLDRIVCMGKRYYRDISLVYPKDKLSYCVLAEPPPWQTKKTKVGIFQRGEFEGKGFHFMLSLPDNNLSLLKEFHFVFVGKGWGEVVNKYSDLGISCSLYEHEDYNAYNELYDSIDYLLVPSLWEGGPMSIVEATKKGIPVISSNVGFAIEDIPVDHIYAKNDEKQLCKIFDSIRVPVRARINRLAGISMIGFAEHVLGIINTRIGDERY